MSSSDWTRGWSPPKQGAPVAWGDRGWNGPGTLFQVASHHFAGSQVKGVPCEVEPGWVPPGRTDSTGPFSRWTESQISFPQPVSLLASASSTPTFILCIPQTDFLF